MGYTVAVDVGGTFTDLVLADDGSERWIAKVLTTPDPSDGVLEAVRRACDLAEIEATSLTSLLYGTTAAVNALLTRSGASVGLITTAGFRQILHLARSQTPGPLVGWLNWTKPEPLASLELTVEVQERVRSDGSIEVPLNEEAAREAISDLVSLGAEVLAVSLLHSYANPSHEMRIREIATELAPALRVTLSSDVVPEYREYERTVTTVANAYISPPVQRAFRSFESRLRAEGYGCRVSVVRSDSGLMSIDSALEKPMATVFSGPSGGVAGALAVARASGLPNILTLDMGGTSTDVSVCIGGEAVISRETVVGDFPIRSASVDVRSVGAGGGSIAHVPPTLRSLRVGPESAGALPGPACYGRGGVEPTVTDANLLLGHLPQVLLGGELNLDAAAAELAVRKLADQLDLDTLLVAQGIIDLANEHMAGALRVMSVERGLDPREFALVAFGGAGPLHANAVAALVGCFPVLVPASAGVLSAYGFHTIGHRNTFARTVVEPLVETRRERLVEVLEDLTAQVSEWLRSDGVEAGKVLYSADMRFLRQGYEIEIPLTAADVRERPFEGLIARFADDHRRLYGYAPEADVEIVNLRAEGRGTPRLAEFAASICALGDGAQALTDTHRGYRNGETISISVYDRGLLVPGDVIIGAAVLTQPDTTTLVLPGYHAEVDALGNLLIWPKPDTPRSS